MTEPTRFRFLVHAPQDAAAMAGELGRADYSYRFVLEYFTPLLARLGDVIEIDAMAAPVEPVPATSDVRLVFAPPHRIPLDIAGDVIPVFAWEYTTIPTEPFADNASNDWREVLRRAPGAITHSQFAVAAVRDALGSDYPVVSVPAPVWDRYAPLFDTPSRRRVTVTATVLDSAAPRRATGATSTNAADIHLTFAGPVFTTVVNPYDGRKVWADTITAFVAALGDRPDATLVIKLVHHDHALAVAAVSDWVERLSPFRCRIVAIAGYLPDAQLRDLIAASDYIVNSSRGEGQCLPLMEFLSAGVPAVAPDHTAMAEYIDADDAFVVGWSREWSWWPHDPRRFLRCLRHPVDWDSLRRALGDAADAVGTDRYATMRRNARDRLHAFCSSDSGVATLRPFLDRVTPPR